MEIEKALYEHPAVLMCAVFEEMARYQATLWREVQRDGVSLMPRPESATRTAPHASLLTITSGV